MIEELLHWDIKNKKLLKLAEEVDLINKEFLLLDCSLNDYVSYEMPNMNRARSLSKKLDYFLKHSNTLNPQSSFDRLVLQEIKDNLFTQKEYVDFFFTKKYNKEWGVRDFFNYCFFPEKEFIDDPQNKGALAYLESLLGNLNHKVQTERENLMDDIFSFSPSFNDDEFEQMLIEQLPRLRELIYSFNEDMGFETEEQIKSQRKISKELEKDMLERRKQRLYNLNPKFPTKGLNLTGDIKDLFFDLVLGYGGYSSYSSNIKTIEAGVERFYFYKDPNTGGIKFYSGELDRVMGHENFHRLQYYFSRFMPPSLSHNFSEGYTITGRTICEGTANVLEKNFLNWMSKNKKQLGLSDIDIKISALEDGVWIGNKVIRLCHSIYHREAFSDEEKSDDDAHLKLAKISKIPIFADSDYLANESIPETFYYSFYIFGKKYVTETLNELQKIETKRLGSKRKANSFLKKNEPVVIQGLLTGNWGWGTHKDFFLKHYWPKARKYCN